MNRKAFLKRFKITKKGKLIRRIAGVGHNFSKKRALEILRKRKKVREDKLVLNYSKLPK
ncbi:50S ribosomal protein L35 [bacterium HR35]|nr:50S ribosomal protein L35 [bacterium HR35]